ncbi:hypothetical protein COU17_00165 [Candidatus Kaiserbacteria bacterium CG10_big_fil_rev_8_21_14_0_10_49_17]|uniref:SMC-Scp complex subunit ScpB n=1 Tax=Candidatus Kaiserbacteria bacterium CG10_big_fil_rev_8_21_14_0_10_49_17 TaxID=1974609 RepID=A0A2M6WF12_9BACT|nr:MAG: hypothetical protein COU17_00165 [Candidatus Kaiserbacteria bacterium CG10_big_fil_rev_8_21_14_0_10_49_17]
MSPLSANIQALLFFKGEPVTIAFLSKTLEKSEREILASIEELETHLDGSGLTLLRLDDSVVLKTGKEQSQLIEQLRKEELSKDLGKAGLETITILLYRGASTRADIDYIRGVNSTYTLRSLSVRGLVEKVQNPDDARSNLYKPTFELLSFLGISKVEELPQFEELRATIRAFETSNDTESST